METQTHEIAAGSAAKGIDVGKLEKELAAMWQPSEDAEGKPAESGVTRVCVLNLVVYAAHHEDRAEIDALLDEVSEQTPSRALILIADREAESGKLEAYVSTRCQASGKGAKQVCGEQVTIEASGPVLESVSSAIEPLLVPDVPVFLWWKDIPHYDDKLFNRLAGMADRIVIDSLAFDHPHSDLLRLAEILRDQPQFMRVSDLNWGRLTSWRSLLASFWDVADYRPHLEKISSVVVEYDPPDVAPDEIAPQASLMLGWLASRLGWEVEPGGVARREGNAIHIRLSVGGQPLEVEFRARDDRQGSDGLIASVALTAGDGDAEFYVAVNQEWTKLETAARVGDMRAIDRVVSYEQKTEGQRLSRELSLTMRDRIYESTIATAAGMLQAITRS
ncbi:MAG: glucose-6-phosphate dehydrogenase assembly protein OpcA [Acidobacteriota bacterium]|nr:glucose-6-phosphate dehydrogenase assembly protein OpcA [Acidobacteriota bacterium]